MSGLISVNIAPSSSVRAIADGSCGGGGNGGSLIEVLPGNTGTSTITVDYIPGPVVINATINAYAFEAGGDKWLGSRCKGSAQASQSNIQKYDYCDDKYYLIPSRNHTAQIQGVVGDSVTLGKTFFPLPGQGDISIANSQLINSISITTEESIEIGAIMSYTGPPMAVTIPDLNPYTLNLGGDVKSGFIKGISINVDFPNPATISYSFEFSL